MIIVPKQQKLILKYISKFPNISKIWKWKNKIPPLEYIGNKIGVFKSKRKSMHSYFSMQIDWKRLYTDSLNNTGASSDSILKWTGLLNVLIAIKTK